jgi:hypothetical protein
LPPLACLILEPGKKGNDVFIDTGVDGK